MTGQYKSPAWEALGQDLVSMLSPEEYDSAKRTTFNAFYTSPLVVSAMFEAISQLGVPKGATILEPGCGSGNFMALAPGGFRFIGVEMDSLSGRIARALYPSHDIRVENFRDSKLPAGRIDAVIGNPPFADVKYEHAGLRLSLHDYFFAKSLDALKPQGVLALVTSHFTLDKQNAEVREHLASKADFLGAIRLPSDAFKQEGTRVVTDIVFLQERPDGEPARHVDPSWLEVGSLQIEGVDVSINRYFLGHPEMVLGSWSRKDRLYGGNDGYSVASNGDLSEQLTAAIGRLPRVDAPVAPSVPVAPEPVFVPPPALPHISEGSFFVGPNRAICQSLGGQSVAVNYGGTDLRADGTMVGRRLGVLIELRDQARRVLQSQNEGWPEDARNEARRSLNRVYDRFVGKLGPINKTSLQRDGKRHDHSPNAKPREVSRRPRRHARHEP